MRSKSFSRFLRDRSDVSVTTSLMPTSKMLAPSSLRCWGYGKLTRVLGILRANILITRIQNILIHQRRTRRDLPKERHFHWLTILDPLSLLHKDLPCILASIFAVETRDTVLFWMMTLFERLESRHQVVASSYTRCDDALGDTRCDCTFDNGGDRVHGADNFGLELRGNVELDLLEEVF